MGCQGKDLGLFSDRLLNTIEKNKSFTVNKEARNSILMLLQES